MATNRKPWREIGDGNLARRVRKNKEKRDKSHYYANVSIQEAMIYLFLSKKSYNLRNKVKPR